MAHHGWWRYISHDPTQNRPQITRSLLGRVAHYAKPYWRSLLLVLTLILLTSLLELVPPVLYGTVIDLLYGNLTNQTLPPRHLRRMASSTTAQRRRYAAQHTGGDPARRPRTEWTHRRCASLHQRSHRRKRHLRSTPRALQPPAAHVAAFLYQHQIGQIISRLNNDVVGARTPSPAPSPTSPPTPSR
ncbi:MAG: hypothetical protein R2856_09310 [Caldilineaceae bacterium]